MADPSALGAPSAPGLTILLVFLAELVCSDDECDVALEVLGDLSDLELLVCDDCGCCLQILSVSAHEAVRLLERMELELPRAA